MSAGNIVGTLINSVLFLVIWLIGGMIIGSFGTMFNRSIMVLPTYQDAVNGFHITQTAYLTFLVLAWIVLWLNFAFNEHNESNKWV